MRNLVLGMLAGALALANWPAQAATVHVFAAASLTDSLKEIAATYSRDAADKIVFNLGASSTLARQIEEGAPADIFFAADEVKMDGLQAKGLLETATRRRRLSNALVIVVAATDGATVFSPKDLLKPEIRRVALGDPRAVPIGIYAREYFEKLGLWRALERKVVTTENVRAALSAVETGDADASVVYRTDAMVSKRVKVAFAVPVAEGPRISYPMALVKSARGPEAALRFLKYLESEEAGKVFERYGFSLASQLSPR
jgi:molybdate transport system substrate-binding protein